MKNISKILNILVCLVMVSVAFVVTVPANVSAATWYVDDILGSGPGNPAEDFTSIQTAIDAANSGDTVYVYSGTYFESLVIDKALILQGEDKYMTIIDSGGTGNAIIVNADFVEINDFTVKGSGSNPDNAGIKINDVTNCEINRNRITSNNWNGIYIHYGAYHNIFNNDIFSNHYNGILGIFNDNNYIRGNNITDHIEAINLSSSSNIRISMNTIEFNDEGIRLYWMCVNMRIDDNIINRNIIGIHCWKADNVTGYNAMDILWNVISYNNISIFLESSSPFTFDNSIRYNYIGIKLDSDSNPALIGNFIFDNTIGIFIDPSTPVIRDNTITHNTYGIYCIDSDPLIENNSIAYNDYGIYLDYSSPVIESNSITNNYYGIYYFNDSNPTITNNNFTDNVFDIYTVWSAEITPKTLNLKSNGRWMTCKIELPNNMDASDIVVSTVRISDINGNSVNIPAESHPTGGGKGVLMVKFDRSEVEDACIPGDATIAVIGEHADGTVLGGKDEIRIIKPGK